MAEREFQDLIIIKRRLSAEAEAVKGGVWKIAFADFMTAMMCFFLVMWLINAANEDTRQAVASYFNPVRLSELNRKGIADPHLAENTTSNNAEATTEAGSPPEPKSPAATGATDGEAASEARDELFRDPYRVLSEIAAEGSGAGGGAAAAGETPGSAGAGTGVATYRDPFDQEVSAQLPPPAAGVAEASSEIATSPASEPAAEQDSETVTAEAAQTAEKGATPADPALSNAAATLAMTAPAASSGDGFPISSPAGTEPHAPVAIPHSDTGQVIEAEIAAAIRDAGGGQPGIAVEDTGEGVLISLTDGVDFGMFEIGSAEPQPETVRIMERIAEILKSRPGKISIRGHTDARPFRGGGYDNWRLSTDRAQIAYYMLVRGGLEESRVLAIEGYADRRLKVPEDPEAAENRRIEILLHEGAE